MRIFKIIGGHSRIEEEIEKEYIANCHIDDTVPIQEYIISLVKIICHILDYSLMYITYNQPKKTLLWLFLNPQAVTLYFSSRFQLSLPPVFIIAPCSLLPFSPIEYRPSLLTTPAIASAAGSLIHAAASLAPGLRQSGLLGLRPPKSRLAKPYRKYPCRI
ncbi:hypothetical protein L1887_06020 [Cichorium endivia]|nr:hypothetical protein L1887_06020 [Cichorium endivia]